MHTRTHKCPYTHSSAHVLHQRKELHCGALIKHTREVIKINCSMVPIISFVKYQGRLDLLLFTSYYWYFNTERLVWSSDVISCAQSEHCIILPEKKQTINNRTIFFYFFWRMSTENKNVAIRKETLFTRDAIKPHEEWSDYNYHHKGDFEKAWRASTLRLSCWSSHPG